MAPPSGPVLEQSFLSKVILSNKDIIELQFHISAHVQSQYNWSCFNLYERIFSNTLRTLCIAIIIIYISCSYLSKTEELPNRFIHYGSVQFLLEGSQRSVHQDLLLWRNIQIDICLDSTQQKRSQNLKETNFIFYRNVKIIYITIANHVLLQSFYISEKTFRASLSNDLGF